MFAASRVLARATAFSGRENWDSPRERLRLLTQDSRLPLPRFVAAGGAAYKKRVVGDKVGERVG
jgi:hypothetical protein